MDNTREKLIELLCQAHNLATAASVFGFGDISYAQQLEMEADHLIANGVTVQQWIHVTERLPEVVDSYIVAIKSKSYWEKDYTYYTDVATYNPYEKAYIDDCWNTYNDWDEGQQYLHITHWMPLPEPPKED